MKVNYNNILFYMDKESDVNVSCYIDDKTTKGVFHKFKKNKVFNLKELRFSDYVIALC